MASAYLSKTSGTTTNNKIGTFSAWIKFSKKTETSSYEPHIFDSYSSSDNRSGLKFEAQKLLFYSRVGASTQVNVSTNRLFRDLSAWYHVVVAIDMTQATSTNRLKMYVNGVQETSMSATTYGSQNDTIHHFLGSVNLAVGRYGGNTSVNHMFDGQLAHVHYIDGTAYAASDFGETDTTTGIWKPKTAPSVTYGNNGYFLKMDNAANMGLDSGGGSNNMTTSGTIIQNKDTPSNVYATLNPLDYSPNPATLQNCNTSYNKSSTGSGHNASMTGTLGVMTGKWYYEFKPTNTSAFVVGMIRTNHGLPNGEGYYAADAGSYGIRNDGKMVGGSESSVSGYSYSANDIFGMAYDFNNGKFYVHVNGTYLTSGDPTSGSTGTGSLGNIALGSNIYVPFVSNANYGQTNLMHFNFGNGYFGTTAISSAGSNGNGSLFEYDVPTGYYALNTKNIGTQS